MINTGEFDFVKEMIRDGPKVGTLRLNKKSPIQLSNIMMMLGPETMEMFPQEKNGTIDIELLKRAITNICFRQKKSMYKLRKKTPLYKTDQSLFEGIYEEGPNQYFLTEHYDISRYWDGLGAYQEEWEKLTRTVGKTKSIGGEAIRAVNTLMHECYTNAFLHEPMSGPYNYLECFLFEYDLNVPYFEDFEPFVMRFYKRHKYTWRSIDGACLGSIFDTMIEQIITLLEKYSGLKTMPCKQRMSEFEETVIISDSEEEDSAESSMEE
jgi:hypothetical protein